MVDFGIPQSHKKTYSMLRRGPGEVFLGQLISDTDLLNKTRWADGSKLHDMTANKLYSMLPGLGDIYNRHNLSWKFEWSDYKWSSSLSHLGIAL